VIKIEPTREQLQQVLDAANVPLDLDTALQDATLRRLLMNGAAALARRESRPLSTTLRRYAGKTDWRARAANDD
jgi:hypothetical protein